MGEERDPERTRAAIFAAALSEFSALGPAGARVDAIAAAAGVNKRMLYHYFGSKEGLFASLLAAQATRAGGAVFRAGITLGEQLASAHMRAVQEADWTRLSVWEGLSGQVEDRNDGHRAAAWSGAVAALTDAQAKGEVDADLDAAQLLLSMLALVMFPVAFPHLTRLITGASPEAPEFVAERARFLKTLAGKLSALPSKPRYRLAATVRASQT